VEVSGQRSVQISILFGIGFGGTSIFCFGSLIGHVLALTVWQRSQVISGSLALLARGRRLPHVVQKSRPLKAILKWDAVVLEGCGLEGITNYV
jgi:hypothetical protein